MIAHRVSEIDIVNSIPCALKTEISSHITREED